MSDPRGPSLVIGIGNVLLRDDGVGVQVVRSLRRAADDGTVELPTGVLLVDGGTLGLDLLPLLSSARIAVLVDAIDLRRTPGAVEAFGGERLSEMLGTAPAPGEAADGTGVSDLLGTARLIGMSTESVAVVGVQPSEICAGLELTEAVRAAVPAAVDMALRELRRLEDVIPSSGAGSSSASRGSDLAGAAA